MHGACLPPLYPLRREKSRTGKGRKGRTKGAPAIAKTKKEGEIHGPADKLHPLVHQRMDTAYICQNADALAPAQNSWIISEEVRGRMCQYSCFEQISQVSLMHDKVRESLRQNVGRWDLPGSSVVETLCSEGRSQGSLPGPWTRFHRSQLGGLHATNKKSHTPELTPSTGKHRNKSLKIKCWYDKQALLLHVITLALKKIFHISKHSENYILSFQLVLYWKTSQKKVV